MEKTPESQYKIRFSDCDPFGHLNNSRYLDYLINAREDHLLEHYQFDLTHSYKQGIGWVVGSHEIAYASPAVYNEVVTIQSALLKVDAAMLHVETVMTNSNKTQLKAVMRTKLIPVNAHTGKREAHTPEFLVWAKTIEHPELSEAITLQERVMQLRTQFKGENTK
ncbi:MAG: thioesterase [Flavobacterium sp. BFFFF1]|uniref:acyl-CoA thioesterase n=1 Tax=unclassified Flavobacterium TaxID=196869 RepID=UPI000BC7647A|nr:MULTISPECIES: acyl-CoA thioesterase [unclassified Flavobacterium]OYU79699.1 MAG: thioesterase [Flavobacterium sp. BFFFF1]